jgi:hypothetical protein
MNLEEFAVSSFYSCLLFLPPGIEAITGGKKRHKNIPGKGFRRIADINTP